MIAFLRGKLIESMPTRAILDINGVGYEVLIPVSTFEKLPLPPAEVALKTVLVVREDAHLLYGFYSREEKDLFLLLTNHVSGIGPKTALAVISGSSPTQFKTAVATQDLAYLSKIKGVGKKTAERIVVELKDKVGISESWQVLATNQKLPPDQQKANDALLALVALGYKQQDALKAITGAGTKGELEEIVREALKRL
ncbi:MAG: Holliday junction branch migration protein RuvA [Verrucomicrobiales bacterium]|jgi:Holliday junction DNA helicase RuvA|nr:Holliday junction branch migration protein RuvA [Verrucomicrobiales bacterium]